ncbi:MULTISPECIES: FeoA family protein [Eubacterium]|jgi:ferrous iron transport protein A|uniref:Ferrous iron transport protein A n=2 Tax=Eubacterium TaxID=1730 RepID=A0A1H4B728_9FIRM|nr:MULTISPECIES: FeoA family protein [Eubacterium]MDD4690635.1 FeoA family protein [Eubacterium aggregans]MEA5073125.1 FeoA family protein [Eubacterium aggregans]SDX43131.1 ferrous iron transport protein A [Eubacterium barkeri]SEA43941.1 ferrous iron transport protein A [Eubacterium aggregans]
MAKNLSELKPGQRGVVSSIDLKGLMRRKLLDMGVTPGVEVYVDKVAPFGDPIEIHLRGYALSLRKKDAEKIRIV